MLLAYMALPFLCRRDRTSLGEAVAIFSICVVAGAFAARGWSLLEWWAEGGDVRWVFDPFEAAGYSSAGAFFGSGCALLVGRFVFGRDAFARLLDAVAPAALLALALARLGCVFERCDPGRAASSLGVLYPDGALLHPFGAYITVGTALVLVASLLKRLQPGQRAVFVTTGYAAVRFVAEFFRQADSLLHFGHVVAVGVAAAALAWWAVDGRDRTA